VSAALIPYDASMLITYLPDTGQPTMTSTEKISCPRILQPSNPPILRDSRLGPASSKWSGDMRAQLQQDRYVFSKRRSAPISCCPANTMLLSNTISLFHLLRPPILYYAPIPWYSSVPLTLQMLCRLPALWRPPSDQIDTVKFVVFWDIY
jgi:hypothetical protein